jgi:hypothetical protein
VQAIRKFILAALFAAPVQPALSANFSDNSCAEGHCTISMRGAIGHGDYDQFMNRLASIYVRQEINKIPKSSSVFLELDSLGGDIKEAIKIAESLTENTVVTNVGPDASCVSACVVVLAGGIARVVYGRIGIHRPFLSDSSSPEKARIAFDEIKPKIKILFENSGVDPALWDSMMAIPSSKVRYLSDQEIENYGLKGRNPAHFDHIDSVRAKRYGIDKIELFRRDELVRKRCTSIATFNSCHDSIMATGQP